MKQKENLLNKIYLGLDIIITLCALYSAYFVRNNVQVFGLNPLFSLEVYSYLPFLVIPIWGFAFSILGIHQKQSQYPRILFGYIQANLLGLLILLGFLYIFKYQDVSRTFLIGFVVLNILLLFLGRIFLLNVRKLFLKRDVDLIYVVIVGTGRYARRFASRLQKMSDYGYRVYGFISEHKEQSGNQMMGLPIIGSLDNLSDLLTKHVIDEVAFVAPTMDLRNLNSYSRVCSQQGVHARLVMNYLNSRILNIDTLDGVPILSFNNSPVNEFQLSIKRLIDVFISIFALIIIIPVIILISIAIKIETGGSFLFKQKRCGKNGRYFTLYKLRSMVINAEEKQNDFIKYNEMTGPVFKMKNDLRVTKVGKFIRKFSIDELPQFFNVLKGDMSLVGPRPPLPSEVENYKLRYRRRLSMRPGLSCLWQISGRNNIDFEKWMELDLDYIDNWSLWLDFKIILKTIPAVIFAKGAN